MTTRTCWSGGFVAAAVLMVTAAWLSGCGTTGEAESAKPKVIEFTGKRFEATTIARGKAEIGTSTCVVYVFPSSHGNPKSSPALTEANARASLLKDRARVRALLGPGTELSEDDTSVPNDFRKHQTVLTIDGKPVPIKWEQWEADPGHDLTDPIVVGFTPDGTAVVATFLTRAK